MRSGESVLGALRDDNADEAGDADGSSADEEREALPGEGEGWVKLRGSQGWRDKDGNTWKRDKKHKDHWDVSDRRGRKVKEVSDDGRRLWPNGPKNKNKSK